MDAITETIQGGGRVTQKEASKIKDEILKKNGTVSIHGTVYVEGVIHIEDAINIIDKYADNGGGRMKDVKHIKALTRIKENYERLWRENLAKEEDVKEEYDAVCAGINALEAEPCEDCVSRQAVIDAIELDCSWDIFDEYGSYTPEGASIIDAIKSVPSVTPARKRGKWICDDNGFWMCDRCQATAKEDGTKGEDPFCWNCGAEMEVDDGKG